MSKRKLKYSEAITEAIEEEMRRDPKVFMMGEDIQISVWGVGKGLVDEFGKERIMHMPISESGFCAAAVGAAATGMNPIVELMYSDFLLVAADAVFNQAAKLNYMSGGNYNAPVTYRLAGAGVGSRGGAHHSQNLEALAMHIPGLKVIYATTPYDAKGLMKFAIRDKDPVLFFEHKLLYSTKGEVPEEEYQVPIGEGIIRREGKDITVVSYGHMLNLTLEVADELYQESNIDVEVYDPRTLRPFDFDKLFSSLEKTGKLLIVEEDTKIGGVGAEISATVAEEKLLWLEAPIKRLAAEETPVPSSEFGKSNIIPQKKDIKNNIKKLLDY